MKRGGKEAVVQLPVHYARIYALGQTQPTTPTHHPSSPIQHIDYPQRGNRTEIYVGAVPGNVLQGLRFHRAWLTHVFRADCSNADQLRRFAAEIREESVLSDPRNPERSLRERHWYVTLVIEDHVDISDDPAQQLLGVDAAEWVALESPDFISRHARTLDQLSAQAAITLAPYRYLWRAWDGPLVQLPTRIALRPLQFQMGRARALVAPPFEQVDLANLQSAAPAAALRSLPMVLHFYLSSMTEKDQIERFFDAFRALEKLCGGLERRLQAKANAHVVIAAATAGSKAATAFQQRKSTLRKRFATLALAFNPTGADTDLDQFDKLYKWRNDLAHGNRVLQSEEAPDAETFDLLHRYLRAVM